MKKLLAWRSQFLMATSYTALSMTTVFLVGVDMADVGHSALSKQTFL
ncbi:hypothetical protein L4D17_20020 [Vibrio splendidus]